MSVLYSMKRTTVHLPADLRARARRCAEELGLTLAELVRVALDRLVSASAANEPDPLFRPIASKRRSARTPRDMAKNHDEYLYGRKSS